ncbi:hypothetical protein [Bacillus pacificus]|uniref:hypothetical protein n=1 Tax=Bacillus pacificus TaxID=2026187 RepID=UPI000772BF63|nr:hypothetical protein [Bacillus pacificus]KXI67257.1 hypothetical protein ACS51_21025 [Bacillus cereus]MCC2352012.1 hypothetical protein [Bacillus pacificus]MCU5467461.1 hypothetical protein [Bacillus pacificus]
MIYKDVELYAKECRITLEQAKVRCSHYLDVHEKIEEIKKCPICEQHSLEVENDGCEYSSVSWIQCMECDFTDDIHKEQYELLQNACDFDEVLAIACTEMETGIKDWNEFVEQSNQSLTK